MNDQIAAYTSPQSVLSTVFLGAACIAVAFWWFISSQQPADFGLIFAVGGSGLIISHGRGS